MHPAQQALVEASDQFVRGFEPRSIPDLNRYLGSQPDAMVQTGHQYRALVSRLVAEFPGAMAVHGFFGDVCDVYPTLAERARTLHDAYRQIHADDLARHETPRVNEHLADVARSANGGNLPTIGGGDTMHENHACMVAAYRTHIAGYEPALCASGAENAWDDFVVYLSGQPVMYYILGQHMAAFAEKLVTAYPVEADVHGYYFALASGYASLSDRSGELTNGFLNANANDTQRHTDPRVNEKWADFANK